MEIEPTEIFFETDPEKVRWEKDRVLYRGHKQGNFEIEVLSSLVKHNHPYYAPYRQTNGNIATFCSPWMSEGLYHTNKYF